MLHKNLELIINKKEHYFPGGINWRIARPFCNFNGNPVDGVHIANFVCYFTDNLSDCKKLFEKMNKPATFDAEIIGYSTIEEQKKQVIRIILKKCQISNSSYSGGVGKGDNLSGVFTIHSLEGEIEGTKIFWKQEEV